MSRTENTHMRKAQDVLLETDVSNNTQVTYTQTPDIYGNLVSQGRSTTTSFYHHDALGWTLALTDANENVTDTHKYFAFGRRSPCWQRVDP